jgi:hypothetical protein
VIQVAHARGLKVLLKPHLDVSTGESRIRIQPDDRVAWFASYQAFIDHYARMAAELHVEEFAVGTELAGVSGDRSCWLRVIAIVRTRYHGPLTYAAWDQELDTVAFLDTVDFVGVDAYWALNDHPTADVVALERAWQPIRATLAALSIRTGRPILFTEAGYTSRRGTATRTGKYLVNEELCDHTEQAAGYQSLLTTFSHDPWWSGVFLWVWALAKEGERNHKLGYAVEGKAAEDVLRRWWTRRRVRVLQHHPNTTTDRQNWYVIGSGARKEAS